MFSSRQDGVDTVDKRAEPNNVKCLLLPLSVPRSTHMLAGTGPGSPSIDLVDALLFGVGNYCAKSTDFVAQLVVN